MKPTVLLISLDGFRYDYLEKYQPPFLNKLAREGVRAKCLIAAPNGGNFDTAKAVLKISEIKSIFFVLRGLC